MPRSCPLLNCKLDCPLGFFFSFPFKQRTLIGVLTFFLNPWKELNTVGLISTDAVTQKGSVQKTVLSQTTSKCTPGGRAILVVRLRWAYIILVSKGTKTVVTSVNVEIPARMFGARWSTCVVLLMSSVYRKNAIQFPNVCSSIRCLLSTERKRTLQAVLSLIMRVTQDL